MWDLFKASLTTVKSGLHAMKQMFGEAEIFPKQILKHSLLTEYVFYHLLEWRHHLLHFNHVQSKKRITTDMFPLCGSKFT